MKVKLDENVPASLGDVLSDHDHEVDTVVAEDLTAIPTLRWRPPPRRRTGC